jgi:hypothetical protein
MPSQRVAYVVLGFRVLNQVLDHARGGELRFTHVVASGS